MGGGARRPSDATDTIVTVMPPVIEIGNRLVGRGHPCFVIAEVGINHNGNLGLALDLIDVAVDAGCDAVKFQKRTPDVCVPADERERTKETPWGLMSYLDYRRRLEFGREEYEHIDRHCRERGILWFASCWDEPSIDFLESFDVPCLKVPSAALTDQDLLLRLKSTGRPLIVSTGMSTMDDIEAAVETLGEDSSFALMHCTSSYPAAPAEINLRMIEVLNDRFGCVVGYSGHEVGLQISLAAVAMGASILERHITLDRAMWGSDQAASVEPGGLQRLVRDVRVIETARGDGVKRVYESELPLMRRLRRAY
jgi:N-acetylneuraminate synthase